MGGARTRTVADFIERHGGEILERWRSRVLEDPLIPRANEQPTPVLNNHIPDLLAAFTLQLRRGELSQDPANVNAVTERMQPHDHAHLRYMAGYDLLAVLREFGHLRAAVLETIERERFEIGGAELLLLHAVIDQVMSQSAQESVRWERQLVQSVVTQSGEGIVVVDTTFRYRIVNETARQLLANDHVAPGLPAGRLALLDDSGAALDLEAMPLTRALRGEREHQGKARVRRPDGSLIRVEYSSTPLRAEDGDIIGAALLFRDRTREFEDEEYRQQAAQFRERFVGMVGHDLRGPLTAIRMSADMALMRDADDPSAFQLTATRALERIRSASGRMERMIRDLLDFTRARLGGGIPVQRQETDLGHLTRTVLEEMAAAFPDRHVEFRRRGDVSGCWDPDRLMQVLANLLGNALTHSPENRPVVIDLDGEREEVEFSVNNGGAPIPPDRLPVIFEPFQVGDEAAQHRGLGLGLFIAQSIAVSHGGSISAVSDAGQGTTFTLRLPRGRPPKGAQSI